MQAPKKKLERGRRSPTYPLNEAIALLRQIRSSLGDGPFGRDGIADALGNQPKSGVLSTKIGTLTHFALLDRDGNVYRISPLGKRVLYPENDGDRTRAIADSAAAPSLYKELLAAFQGKALPTLFKNVLIQSYGVASGSANDVSECFRQSMEFAGLLRHGMLHETPLLPETDMREDEDVEEQEAQIAGRSESTRDSSRSILRSQDGAPFSIPLSKGRTASLSLPRPLEESDHSRLISWLELMKDVLLEQPGGDE